MVEKNTSRAFMCKAMTNNGFLILKFKALDTAENRRIYRMSAVQPNVVTENATIVLLMFSQIKKHKSSADLWLIGSELFWQILKETKRRGPLTQLERVLFGELHLGFLVHREVSFVQMFRFNL